MSSCVPYVPELKKKGIKIKESTCIRVYTFKDSKIITVDRNEDFIFEVIDTLV